MTSTRFYASRNDAGVPTVIDWENPTAPEDLPGSSMWEAKWTAAHYNGAHELKRHARCPVCPPAPNELSDDDAEPCLCGTDFTCLARHEEPADA